MGTFILKRKTFSKYDETDNLKRMNDADILNEQKKSNPGWGGVLRNTLTGAAVGAAALGGMKAFKGKKITGNGLKKAAILGAGIGAISGLSQRRKEKDDINFYNKRLNFAQSVARQRERADWRANMTNRDGYSY